jgi:glycosyltransferase involved in cell wall biosynthesis
MSGMRIGWATPWNERSAIAHAADDVARELTALGHAITIIRTETEKGLELPSRPSQWPVRLLAEVSDAHLDRDFDVVVAHIGDYVDFHGPLISRISRLGCVGIFHDAYLADLVGSWAHRSGGGGDAELREWVEVTYGADVWPVGESYVTSENLYEVSQRRPMLEWLARQTIASIAHSNYYAGRLRAATPGPVAVVPLAMTFRDLPPPPGPWSGTTIAVIGHLNPNKHIDQLILAIGSSPFLRGRCRLRLIGEATEAARQSLVSLAAIADIAPLEMTGWVSDVELRWQLRDVDVISCLRGPVLEGASASLILGMASRRPTLVSDHAFYADIPDNCVLKCTPNAEALDVMLHLERLVASPDEARAMGQRAHSFALEHFSPASYAKSLISLIEQSLPHRWVERGRYSLHDSLAQLGVGASDPVFARVNEIIGWFYSTNSAGNAYDPSKPNT